MIDKYRNKGWKSSSKNKKVEEVKKLQKGFAKVKFKSNIDVWGRVFYRWTVYELPVKFMQQNGMCNLIEQVIEKNF